MRESAHTLSVHLTKAFQLRSLGYVEFVDACNRLIMNEVEQTVMC